MKRIASVLLVVMTASWAAAGVNEIRLGLRIKPKLKVTGTEKVYLGPILLETKSVSEGEERARSRVEYSAVREFKRYLYKMLRRETRLNLVDSDELPPLPTNHLPTLAKDTDFWVELGNLTGAAFIVAATLDVDVLDREGYQTEEYVSPEDGKTYYRQVLVEETGFSYDILIMVFSSTDGSLLHKQQITAFKERRKEKLDQYSDMYNDIYSLENKIAGIFVPRTIIAKRHLFTN